MSEKISIKGQLNGHLTIIKSHTYPMEAKEQVLSAPDGKVRKFRKVLLDPETGNEVVIEGPVRISGVDKDTGEPIEGKNQSLTAYVSFQLDNVESILVDKAEKAEPNFEDAVEALLGAAE